MKVLVIGSGGREHAIAWKLAQSKKVTQVFVATGNGGTALEEDLQNIPLNDVNQLADWAIEQKIQLTVVGPEAPLAAGVVDEFTKRGLKIFGPTKQAAQLESSKAFSKDFMQRHKIPTAQYQTFTEISPAKEYVQKLGAPIVVKADGLAAGKGVVVAQTIQEANAAIEDMLGENSLGVAHNESGARVVIEEFLDGVEASFIVMCDGKNVLPLATSQDHKRLLDNDEGLNTGGMGAYSPALVVTPDIHAKIMKEIILPTVEGMGKENMPFTGFLYAGVMIGKNGEVKTLEFNTRMGDPETQPIMMRLKSDLLDVLQAAVNKELDKITLEWDRRTALGVVLAAHGYPQNPRKNDEIKGLDKNNNPDVKIFHAGTKQEDNKIKTSGGRVLCVTALADGVKLAQIAAYNAIKDINFDGMQYRTDIGAKALK